MGFCVLWQKSKPKVLKAGLQLFLRCYFYPFSQQLNIIFGQQMGIYFVNNQRGTAFVFENGNLAAIIFNGVLNSIFRYR